MRVKQRILQNSQEQNVGFQVPTAMTTYKDVFFTYAKDYIPKQEPMSIQEL